MHRSLLITCLALFSIRVSAFLEVTPDPEPSQDYRVNVLTTTSHHSTDLQYLSLALSSNVCNRIKDFDSQDAKLRNLASALAPAVVRFGGISGYFHIFQPDDGQPAVPVATRKEWERKFGVNDFYNSRVGRGSWSNYNCTAASYLPLKEFFQNVSWDVSLQMNYLLTQNGRWDPSNARLWLDSLGKMGMEVKYFQLTNEPNSDDGKYGERKSEEDVTEDFRIFREFLNNTAYKNSFIIGPDVTSLVERQDSRTYQRNLMKSGLWKYIDLLGIHHYYVDGKASNKTDFSDSTNYNQINALMDEMRKVKAEYNLALPVVLSETSSAHTGGTGNLSNRYAGAMMWLDQLGLVALNGGLRINYQVFWSGAYYSMIDVDDRNPNPTYYVSVLFKRLVNGPVLNVTLTPFPDHQMRVYAHCARTDGPYPIKKGAIVLYYINLRYQVDTLDLSQFKGQTFQLFQLRMKKHMESREMYLNDKLLSMNGDDLPDMPPVTTGSTTVTIDRRAIGFIVCQDANASVCL